MTRFGFALLVGFLCAAPCPAQPYAPEGERLQHAAPPDRPSSPHALDQTPSGRPAARWRHTTSGGVALAWTRLRASERSPGRDEGAAVEVAADGSVYVAGVSTRLPYGTDLTLIKYDAAGREQWAVRHPGEAGGDAGATDLVVDAAGTIYVTGYAAGLDGTQDCITLAYAPDGTLRWQARYGGAGAESGQVVRLDAAGNVYVAGSTNWRPPYGDDRDTSDFLLLKYDEAGREQWAARYDGPHGGSDTVADLAVDAAGRVAVTGTSYEPGRTYATTMYDADGVRQWVARYEGPAARNTAAGVAIDGDGNVYVTGTSTGAGGLSGYATIKYDAGGAEAWVARYDTDLVEGNYAGAVAVDAAGNVYVTGAGASERSRRDFVTISYDSTGARQWMARYDGPGRDYDEARLLHLDAAGNVYVAGESRDQRDDYAVVAYDAAGNERWAARYDGPGHGYDAITGMALDEAGNVYVTGRSPAVGDQSDYDAATIKYDAAGTRQWLARYDGPGTTADVLADLAVDAAGDVYVTGSSFAPEADYLTVAYDAHGTERWAARYEGPDGRRGRDARRRPGRARLRHGHERGRRHAR